MNPSTATLHDIQSGQTLAEITLVGSPIRADELICASGQLQGFNILTGRDNLRYSWLAQKVVLLRVGNTLHQVKISTYPSDGENQGHLDFIPGTKQYCPTEAPSKPRSLKKRGLAMLQAILSS